MAELTYTKVDDYYIPDLILDEESEQDVFDMYPEFWTHKKLN